MAGRTQNVGRRDRIVRTVLTPLALVAALWLYLSSPFGLLTIGFIGGLLVLAFILGGGALTGTCGVYAALGIDTCGSCEVEYTSGDLWG